MARRNESFFYSFPAPEAVGRTPIRGMVEEYLGFMRLRRTIASVRSNASYLRRSFGFEKYPGPHIEAQFLEDVTTGTVSRFLDTIVRIRRYSPKTGNRIREVLHRFFNWCMHQRDVVMPYNRNPVTDAERFREGRPTKRFLMLPEIRTQLNVMQALPDLQAMVATMIYAGLRRSELLWLCRNDVDLNAGVHGMLRIRAKDDHGVMWSPKTGRDRGVPINSALRPFLEQHCEAAPADREWFFVTPKGRRWDPDNFGARLRLFNQASGLPWTCLDYRHTFGSQLAMKGESLFKIAELMGNSPEICRRHYATLLTHSLIETVEFPEG